jgi:putative heme-binding domain-containing protein
VIEKAGAANGQNDQPGQIDYAYALRVIDNGWTPEQKQKVTAFYAKASKWRGGSTFAGHVNNLFDATIVKWTDAERQAAYRAVPLFAPLSPEEMAAAEAAAAARGRGGFGGPPPGAPGAPGAPGPGPAGSGGVAAVPTAQAAAGGGGRRGGGGGRGATVPGLARNVPLGSQERYDNLVFPRGGGPGNLTGRGGAPNAQEGAQVFEQSCASCHKFGSSGATYGPELTNIAGTMLRRDVLRAIFFPDEQVATKYRTTVINTRDNQELRGLLINETATTVVLKTAEQADPVTLQKAQIVKRTTENTSIMPPNLPDQVGDQNISHVVAYLMAGPPK